MHHRYKSIDRTWRSSCYRRLYVNKNRKQETKDGRQYVPCQCHVVLRHLGILPAGNTSCLRNPKWPIFFTHQLSIDNQSSIYICLCNTQSARDAMTSLSSWRHATHTDKQNGRQNPSENIMSAVHNLPLAEIMQHNTKHLYQWPRLDFQRRNIHSTVPGLSSVTVGSTAEEQRSNWRSDSTLLYWNTSNNTIQYNTIITFVERYLRRVQERWQKLAMICSAK